MNGVDEWLQVPSVDDVFTVGIVQVFNQGHSFWRLFGIQTRQTDSWTDEPTVGP